MAPRPFVQAMNEPFPVEGSYEDLASEMVQHGGVPHEKEADMVALFKGVATNVTDFLLISKSQFDVLTVCLALDTGIAMRTRQILGTVFAPHCFTDDEMPSTSQTSTPTTRHKGAGVDCVQKARSDPQKYGLPNNKAIPGPLPQRPIRELPPLPNTKPSTQSPFNGNGDAPRVATAANSTGPSEPTGMGQAGQALLMQLLTKQLSDKETNQGEGPPPPPPPMPPKVRSRRVHPTLCASHSHILATSPQEPDEKSHELSEENMRALIAKLENDKGKSDKGKSDKGKPPKENSGPNGKASQTGGAAKRKEVPSHEEDLHEDQVAHSPITHKELCLLGEGWGERGGSCVTLIATT